jgi:hypothetical protein
VIAQGGSVALGALIVGVLAAACGDPGDVQVPLLPQKTPQRTAPVLARALPEAVTRIRVATFADAGAPSCPLSFSTSLGQSSEVTALGGAGERVIDGASATVACVVCPLVAAPDRYDVDLVLEHERLPRFVVRGVMSEAESTPVTLQLTTPDGVEIEAECAAQVISIQPGSVRFRLVTCDSHAAGAALTGCGVDVVATFENCAH